MYHQNHVLNALRATAYTADPRPDAMKESWERAGLSDAFAGDVKRDFPDDFVPTGNAKFDAVVHAANPRLHYGYRAGFSFAGRSDGNGGFVPGTEFDFIAVPPLSAFRGDDDNERRKHYMRTFAHELVHWTQAGDRLNRPRAGMSEEEHFLSQLFGPPETYVQEELIAEMGATLLLDAAGEDPDMPARAHYVANWLSAVAADDHERLLDKAEAEAKRAVNWLLAKAHVGVQEAA